MAKVFDVGVVLDHDAKDEEVNRLFEQLGAQRINCVALDEKGKTGRRHELRFAIYADMGQFVASRVVSQCVESVFQTDMVAVNERR
jgi:hypothetical protein